MSLSDRIISAESGGNATARNPRSSAYGAGQFIDSTWLATIAKHRPDLIVGKSPAEILAMRADPALSYDMTAAYASDNAGILTGAGHQATPSNTYLAHFAGPQGAIGLLNADPSAPVSSVMTPAAMKANPFLTNMTAGDLRAWADRKMGGAPAPMSMAGPSPSEQPSAGMSAPAIAEPSSEIGNPGAALSSFFQQMAEPQMQAPLSLAPRPRVDLSNIATLARVGSQIRRR